MIAEDKNPNEYLPGPPAPAPETQRRLSLRKKLAVGFGALLLTVGWQNLDEVYRWKDINENGNMMPDIPDCPDYEDEADNIKPLPDVRQKPNKNSTNQTAELTDNSRAELSMRNIRSSAHRNELGSFNLLASAEQALRLLDHQQVSFTSKYSGIEFQFYSDRQTAAWELDPQAFDTIFHHALLDDTPRGTPHNSHLLQCLRKRIIEDREFAGKSFNVFIPSSPLACMANGRLIYPEETADACHQSGFTPPLIQVELLLWKPVSERIMILTGGKYTSSEREARMSRLLLHESFHAYLTLTNTSVRLNPDEKWTKYNERLFARGVDLPTLLTYDTVN